jgi:hypothetical protein
MAINKTKYDGVHFQVAVMNMKDGSVQVHGAGCADLKRGKNFAEKFQADEVWDCIDREDIREAYNADFDEETDGWYDMTWMPCASHVPDRTEAPVEESKVEVKRGPKWTYIHVNGVQVMEVRSEFADQVLANINFFA